VQVETPQEFGVSCGHDRRDAQKLVLGVILIVSAIRIFVTTQPA